MNVIEVTGLTKNYGHGRGIFDVTFDVAKGETLGFLGPNVAGKSKTMRLLMGVSKPKSCQAAISGMDYTGNHHSILANVGYLPGELAFPDELSGIYFIRMMQDMRGIRNEKHIAYSRLNQVLSLCSRKSFTFGRADSKK